VTGTKSAVKAFPGWFELYFFAHIPPAAKAGNPDPHYPPRVQ
jgi:hypothetical protein